MGCLAPISGYLASAYSMTEGQAVEQLDSGQLKRHADGLSCGTHDKLGEQIGHSEKKQILVWRSTHTGREHPDARLLAALAVSQVNVLSLLKNECDGIGTD